MKRFTGSAAVASALLAVGCTSGSGPSPAAGPTAARGACSAVVPSADVSGWQTVEADGFSFCVPPDWTASGRTWSRGTARVTWGVGRTVATADVPAIVRAANRPVASCVPSSAKGTVVHRRPEMIDGREAQVWRNRYRQGFYTGAHWSAPHVYIVGEATDSATADLEMVILRTTRVATR